MLTPVQGICAIGLVERLRKEIVRVFAEYGANCQIEHIQGEEGSECIYGAICHTLF